MPPSSHERRHHLRLLATLSAAAVLAAIVLFADDDVIHWVGANVRGTVLFDAANWWTEIGRSNWTFIAAGGALLIGLVTGRRRLAGGALLLIATVGATGILVNLVKVLVGRARPKLIEAEGHLAFTPFSIGYDWNSFPSGHATTALAIAGTFWVLDPRRRWLWLGLGVSVALTRVALGAHYPGDILAGGVLGWSVAVLMSRTRERWWPHGLRRFAEPGPTIASAN
jgi:membrane-associated phospholipid phosphatase